MFFVLLWLGCIAGTYFVASSKGRSGCGFALLAVIFGPLALIGAAVMSKDQDALDREAVSDGDLQPCPACLKPIPWEASVCRYCRSEVGAR